MRYFAILAAVLSVGTLTANAADVGSLPAKAPKQLVYPYTGSGWYFGLGSVAEQTTAAIDGSTGAGLQAFGGSLGGVGGYRWGAGNIAFAVEGELLWNNLGGSTACTATNCSVGSRFTALERAKAIVPIDTFTALFPALNLPNVPVLPALPNFVPTGSHTYAFFGLKEDDVSASLGLATGRAWQVSPGGGVGIETLASNGSVIDLWAGYFNPSSGFSVGAAHATQGRQMLAGVSWLF